MGNFIRKIFQNKIDDSVHNQFVRFSRGVFDNKAIINASRNGKIKLSSTFELSAGLAIFLAALAKNIHVTGILMSRTELKDMQGDKKKGIFIYEIDQDISFEKLSEMSKNAFAVMLDCSANGISLKTKKTLPKPGAKGADKVNDKFCVAQLDIKFWPNVKDELLFNLPDGKKYRTVNKYEITELILPENEQDSERLRLLTKRKGKLVRKSVVDGKEITEERSFIA